MGKKNKKRRRRIKQAPTDRNAVIVEHCITTDADTPGETEMALQWLKQWRKKLNYVSENQGCGCCVSIWVIRGNEAIIDTLPSALRSTKTLSA